MGLVVGGLAAITLLMPRLGFVLTVLPIMAVLMQAVDRKSWWSALLVSSVATLGVYLPLHAPAGKCVAARAAGFLRHERWTFFRASARVRRHPRAQQPALLLHRLPGRHFRRRAAGRGPARRTVGVAAGDVRAATGRRHRHAGRHFLRRHVRRIDHIDPRQYSRARRHRSSLVSMGTRWRARGGPEPRSGLRPSAHSWPER